jgi:hypothetical protein
MEELRRLRSGMLHHDNQLLIKRTEPKDFNLHVTDDPASICDAA